MTFSQTLRKAFDRSPLKLCEFASQVGVTPSTAHAWLKEKEKGGHSVQIHRLDKIARVLEIDAKTLKRQYMQSKSGAA